MKENKLLKGKPKVINAGLRVFHTAMIDQSVPSVQMSWRPSANGNIEVLKKLEKMMF